MKINFNEIINRIKNFVGSKKDKDIADIIGISTSDFSRRKKIESDTFFKLFVEWGMKNKINLNWIFFGYGSPYLDESKDNNIDELLNEIRKTIRDNNFKILKLNKE